MTTHDDDDIPETSTIYVVNHDAMYWRSRCLTAERELARLQAKYDESVETGMKLARISEVRLLEAILAGAYDTASHQGLLAYHQKERPR